ncbi:MAG: polysaccharide deacetylase family protein [Spirochaetales bacterium]|nr:polysaccharide deacetylase family protein [Spirochaetales bacterium]
MPVRSSAPQTGRKLNDCVTVKTWHGGRTSALSLTFDDSSRDHVRHVKPILDRFGCTATFYVITAALDTAEDRNAGWEEFASVAADGHEIGSHTVTHARLRGLPQGGSGQPNTCEWEIAFSKSEIERRYPGVRCLTMSYPFADSDADIETIARRHYLSARVGDFFPDNPIWNSASPTDWMRIVSFIPRFPPRRTTPEGDLPELERTKKLIGLAIERGEWAVIMIHSVVPFELVESYGGYETMSTEWLEALCGWIRTRGDIWLDTVAHVTLYARERDAVRVEGFTAAGDKIEFALVDDLDTTIFNHPLTLEVNVPGDWRRVRVLGAASVPEAIDVTDGHVRFDAVPAQGRVRLEKRTQGRPIL